MPDTKIFWLYILDACDVAGFWKECYPQASFHTGFKFNETILQCFEGRIERIEPGLVWIIRFVEFQHSGGLSETCKPHQPIMKLLMKHGLLERVMNGMSTGKGRVI